MAGADTLIRKWRVSAPGAPAFVLAGLVLAAAGPGRAAGAFYVGTWTFIGEQRAPWADRQHPLDPAEPARLHGKTIVITAQAISGPPPYICRNPHFRIHDYAADMLFEGAFGDMHDRDHSADPAKIAAALGFHGATFKTLESGCDFDIHFLDGNTAKVGLNDFVYTLKRR